MRNCVRWTTRAICFRRATCTRCTMCPEIVDIGISALKIEGRYKDADYVALTTRAYRKAVDEAVRRDRRCTITAAEEMQLEQVYSRGLGAYFI